MAANSEKGEVSLVAGGQTYTLRLDMNAICLIQDKSGLGIVEALSVLQSGKFDPVMRVILWGMLVDGHPDMSVEAAGRLLPAGGVVELLDKMRSAINAAFPAPEPAENPQPASP